MPRPYADFATALQLPDWPLALISKYGYNVFGASGDLDILDGGDLTIQGNGAANTIP